MHHNRMSNYYYCNPWHTHDIDRFVAFFNWAYIPFHSRLHASIPGGIHSFFPKIVKSSSSPLPLTGWLHLNSESHENDIQVSSVSMRKSHLRFVFREAHLNEWRHKISHYCSVLLLTVEDTKILWNRDLLHKGSAESKLKSRISCATRLLLLLPCYHETANHRTSSRLVIWTSRLFVLTQMNAIAIALIANAKTSGLRVERATPWWLGEWWGSRF